MGQFIAAYAIMCCIYIRRYVFLSVDIKKIEIGVIYFSGASVFVFPGPPTLQRLNDSPISQQNVTID